MQRAKLRLPAEDEITRGLVAFVSNKKIPLWLSFATQIFLDIHHGLRQTKTKAFNDLQFTALRTKKTIDEYWELSSSFSFKPAFWPKGRFGNQRHSTDR